ncbi:MAG: O-antigen ligase family protein [Burkholderiales bacterium]|nr:O-antigen ligase family protein [Burkholderiales bacterium]
MSFLTFQLYLFFTFLRPVELFAQWLIPYRPMLVLWLFAFALALIQVFRQKQVAAQKAHYVLLAGLTLAIALSLILPNGFSGAIAGVSEFSAPALLFVLISFNLTSVERLRAACYVILLSMVILSFAGINAYYTGYMSQELVLPQRIDEDTIDEMVEKPDIPADDKSGHYMWRIRAVGFLNDPNDFAQAIVMTMPMLWWLYRRGRWIRNCIYVGVPGLAMGYAVFLTNSRGAMLGMASLLFFGVRNLLGTTRTVLMMGVMGAGAMLGNMTGGRGFSSQEESAGQRIEAWYEGFMMLKSSPLFGVGFQNFTEHHYLTAHNSFVLCFAELGLFGYFFWLALLVLSYRSVDVVAQNSPVGSLERDAGLVLRSSFIGYMTCAWFLSRTYQSVLYALIALCAASWYCAQKNAEVSEDSVLKKPVKWLRATFLMMGFSLFAVYIFIFTSQLKG